MSKVTNIAAGLAVVPVLAFAAPVFADSPGDLAGGADIYQVRNVTQNGNYSSAVNAACGETVKYSVKLSNTDFGALSDVTVKASLTSGEMNATAKTSDNGTTTTSGKVTVTLPAKASLGYQTGTTKLYTVDGQLIKDLADGVTTDGVNAGTLNGSTREFLQFQAKVNCETTPPVTPPTTTTTKTTPKALPNTGAGQVFGLAGAAVVAGAVASRLFLSRRLSRQ